MPDPPCTASDRPDPTFKDHSSLRDALDARLQKRLKHNLQREMSVEVASKKSWSPVFKDHCYRQELEECRRLERAINQALYSENDPIKRGLALAKLAKEIGL